MKQMLVTAWIFAVVVASAYTIAGVIRFSNELDRTAPARRAIGECNAEGYHLQDCVKWHGGTQ